MKKKFFSLILVFAFCLSFFGCAGKGELIDIITQKVRSKDKIDITVLVKYAFTINAFEEAIEAKFPNINIIQVGNYTSSMGIDEYEARLEHDDLTDIVMTWPLDVGEEYWEDRLIDLSTLSVSRKYTAKATNAITALQGGKQFYLPGPSQIRGIVYNKTLFNENGWAMPTNYNEFASLCQVIEGDGIRSLQLGLANPEVLDTAFVGYGYGSSFSTPSDAEAMMKYNNGTGSFADNYMPALQNFEKLKNDGIIKAEDLEVNYAKREKMLFSRECAMVEDSVLLTTMGNMYGSTDEFALMPFFNREGSDWGRAYPVCFIGANKKLEKEKKSGKYDAAMEVLEYISTPEGQEALMGDNGGMLSSLKGMYAPDIPEIESMRNTLNAGRYGVFNTFEKSQDALRDSLGKFLKGEITTLDEIVKRVDAQNNNPILKKTPLVIGQASRSFSLMETGGYICDAMREEANTDFALFLDNGKDGTYNGKGVSGKFYEGDITTADLNRVFPDVKSGEKMELWKVTMTGADLIKTLEYAIAVDNDRRGWFYYFSGLKMQFNPTEAHGKRVKKITTSNGKTIKAEEVYSIAIMDMTAPEEYFKTCEKTGKSIKNLVEAKIAREGRITPPNDRRFTIIN